MKKLVCFFLIFVIGITISSCSKKDLESPIESVQSALISLEFQVKSDVLSAMPLTKEIVNVEVFDEIKKLRSVENAEDYRTIVEPYKGNSEKVSTRSFSREEELFYQSIFSSMEDEINENKIKICDLYLAELPEMSIKEEIKEDIANRVIAFRDLVLIIDYIDETATLKTDSKSEEWDCPYKTCFDCCFTSKMEAIMDSNWIEIAIFVSGIPFSVIGYGASCAWDCTVD